MKKLIALLLMIMGLMAYSIPSNAGSTKLVKDFYNNTCPSAENIIREETWKAVKVNPAMAAKLLRIHYHDCFVRGCEASILIDSVGSNQAEKDSGINLFVSGYDVIDDIKEKLEERCPGIVSCADILALVARDAASFQARTPLWEVLTGRRDGLVSNATEALHGLPSPFSNITILESFFARNGLSLRDLVVLSGAHTIGVAPCVAFSDRLTGDPTMNATYAASLRKICKGSELNTTVSLDPQSSISFDSHYYAAVKQHMGLMGSDAALLQSEEAKKIIDELLEGEAKFLEEFGIAMRNMGDIGVLTGSEGQIRRKCRAVA